MATYLVTGGAGFIGSHLCDQLIKEHQVIVLDNLSTGSLDNLPKGVELIRGDVRDINTVESAMSQVDGCFHLAAMVSVPLCNEDFLSAHQVNLTATLNVLESAKNLAKRSKIVPIVFASSCAVYGENQQLPNTERTPTIPISIYASSKLTSEYYGRFTNELYQVPFTALRLFNVYGVRQKLESSYSGVIPIFLNALLHDKPCYYFGDGSQSRDFVSVHDIVQFFIRAMMTSTNKMRFYNVCTGHNTDIKTIANLLSQVLDKKLVSENKPAKVGDILHSVGNPDLAKNELGIVTNINIESGIRDYVAEVLRLQQG